MTFSTGISFLIGAKICKYLMQNPSNQYHQWCACRGLAWHLTVNRLIRGDKTLTHWSLEDLDVILKRQFEIVIYWFVSTIRSPYDNALRWLPRDLTHHRLTLVQIMAQYLGASSYYLNQCWPSSMICMASLLHNEVTHWGQDKMVAILQTAFSNVFFNENHRTLIWITLNEFLRDQLTIIQHWLS